MSPHPSNSATEVSLAVHSVDVLISGQNESGAFVASPNFPMYRYSWLRDGAFCARALDIVGRLERADRFHQWVARALLRHRDQAEELIRMLDAGTVPPPADMLPTRYALDGQRERPGEIEDEPWPNYQLDGYGAWLCELSDHVLLAGADTVNAEAVDLTARYLAAAWRTDCYDCWEELGDGQHASTLAAVAAGLSGAARLLGEPKYQKHADEVTDALLRRFTRNGLFRKGADDDRLDASLLWLSLPFRIVEPEDPMMRATAEAIRVQLRGGTGGIYRYLGDTYYGGGEWILLTCWLGWYDAVTGNEDGYRRARDWVVAQATPARDLPEQTTVAAQDELTIEQWVSRWGPAATPLLWSHAMYLIMSEAAQRWT